MKKLILSITAAIILSTALIGCNSQENLQDANTTQSPAVQESSQVESIQQITQEEVSSVVGTYEFSEYNDNGVLQTLKMTFNSDETFSATVVTKESSWNNGEPWKSAEISGKYTQEDNQWILLTCNKLTNNYKDVGEQDETPSQEDGNVFYASVKDADTLLVESGDFHQIGDKPEIDGMFELTRVN